MGWNDGYSIMEQTIITAYDSGALTKERLNTIMEPYAGRDVDHGGCYNLRSKDGLSADEIVCQVMEPERFATIPPMPEQISERVQQTPNGFVLQNPIIAGHNHVYGSWQEALQDEYNCAIYDLWVEITRREWDFW